MPTPTSVQRGSFKKYQGQRWTYTHSSRPPFPNFKDALNHGHEFSASKNDENTNYANEIRVPENDVQALDEVHWDDKIDRPRLTSEGLRQWEMHAHVDHVFDLVPFWQRGMDAAEKGEVLRLEEFLDKMEGDGGWRTANEVLGMLGEWKASPSEQARAWGQPGRDDWAVNQRGAWEPNSIGWGASQGGGWGAASTRIASDATESSRGRDSGWDIGGGPEFKMTPGKKNGWGARARVKVVRALGGGGGRKELHQFADAIARQEAVNEERRRQMHLFFEMSMEQKIQKIEETICFLRTHAAT